MIARFREAGIRCVPTVGASSTRRRWRSSASTCSSSRAARAAATRARSRAPCCCRRCSMRCELPVVAAGGFADGRGLAAALAYGAQGIAMGTRFLMTRDCPVPDPTKTRYIGRDDRRHRRHDQVDGMPQRMIRNEVLAGSSAPARCADAARASSALALKKITGATLRRNAAVRAAAWPRRRPEPRRSRSWPRSRR